MKLCAKVSAERLGSLGSFVREVDALLLDLGVDAKAISESPLMFADWVCERVEDLGKDVIIYVRGEPPKGEELSKVFMAAELCGAKGVSLEYICDAEFLARINSLSLTSGVEVLLRASGAVIDRDYRKVAPSFGAYMGFEYVVDKVPQSEFENILYMNSGLIRSVYLSSDVMKIFDINRLIKFLNSMEYNSYLVVDPEYVHEVSRRRLVAESVPESSELK